MNDLQKEELKLLKCFIDTCDKLNLMYYLVCGSALGAIKYKGFIPWDDDIDVALPRKDYEKFCNLAVQYLPENIFVQTYKTDNNFPQIFCKLRNSDTTYIEKTARKLNINHGVYIDIFPLDGYPSNKLAAFIVELNKKFFQSAILSNYEVKRTGKSKVLYKVFCFFKVQDKCYELAKKYEKMICKYKWDKSAIIANHGNWQGKLEYAPKWQYGEGVYTTFEGIKVRVPENYNEYLTQKYGEWMEDIPEDEQKGHHYYEICDVSRPYTYYTMK